MKLFLDFGNKHPCTFLDIYLHKTKGCYSIYTYGSMYGAEIAISSVRL